LDGAVGSVVTSASGGAVSGEMSRLTMSFSPVWASCEVLLFAIVAMHDLGPRKASHYPGLAYECYGESAVLSLCNLQQTIYRLIDDSRQMQTTKAFLSVQDRQLTRSFASYVDVQVLQTFWQQVVTLQCRHPHPTPSKSGVEIVNVTLGRTLSWLSANGCDHVNGDDLSFFGHGTRISTRR
jgi:hypothetical protein